MRKIKTIKVSNHYADNLRDKYVMRIFNDYQAYDFPDHPQAPQVAQDAVTALSGVADRSTIAQALQISPVDLAELLSENAKSRPGRRR